MSDPQRFKPLDSKEAGAEHGLEANRPLPRPVDRVLGPLQQLGQHKLAGALLLITATVAALVWANSSASALYDSIFATKVSVGVGDFQLSKPLILWINDGLMAVFFFVVGLEVKREVLEGELSSLKKAILPALCAVGGMAVPALLFSLVNRNGTGAAGWGIPMATDIAFALGVLALLGTRAPVALKVFLTAVAIADDIGAIIVIAIFYTEDLGIYSLVAGGIGLIIAVLSNALGVRNSIFYFILGLMVWLAFLKSGVHATLAAVLMAFAIPARTRIDLRALLARLDGLIDEIRRMPRPAGDLLDADAQHALYEAEAAIEQATAPLQRLEHALMPLVVFVVLPVFALANAGVSVTMDIKSLSDPVVLGIIAGLTIGKPVGIGLTGYIAVRLKIAAMPDGLRPVHLLGAGLLAGVGFTMALFIASLAFADPVLLTAAKTGILLASLLSGVAGFAVLRWGAPPRR